MLLLRAVGRGGLPRGERGRRTNRLGVRGRVGVSGLARDLRTIQDIYFRGKTIGIPKASLVAIGDKTIGIPKTSACEKVKSLLGTSDKGMKCTQIFIRQAVAVAVGCDKVSR